MRTTRYQTPGRIFDKLPFRQRLFCLHYLSTLNGAEAARLSGYSTKSARYTARDLLRQERIQQALCELLTPVATTDTGESKFGCGE